MPDLALKLREQVLPDWNFPGGRYRRGINSENHVWDGQNGATSRRRTPLSFTLHRTAGISLTGRNAYSLMFGQGWANVSMPKGAGELRENQSGHWDDSWDAKRSTSPNRSQIWATVWWFSIHSPGLSFCLDKKNRLQGSKLPEREPLSGRGTLTETKGEDGVQGARPWTPLVIYEGYHRSGGMTPPEKREKVNQCQEDGSELQAVYVPGEELSLPLKNAPQLLIDASVVTMWRRWIASILTPLRRKVGSERIWTEFKWTPKNTVCREGVRTLFLVFVLRPRARMWWRTISLW